MPTTRRRNPTFALIIPRFEDFFHSYYAEEIIKGVGQAASHLHTDILMHITERFDHHDWLDSSVLSQDYIEGIIFADIDSDVETLQKVISNGTPYIVLNNEFVTPINSIFIDNKSAAVEVIEHLIRLGHSKIATIAGDLYTQAGRMRLEGYKEALRRHGFEIRQEYITTGNFLRTPARKAAQALLKLKERPTAIFAASDVMALELIDEAKRQNIRIPDELSVVGFDDNPLIEYSSVKLTTVSQPLVEMGRLGVEHLNQICQRTAKIPVKVILKTEFVSRESTKALI